MWWVLVIDNVNVRGKETLVKKNANVEENLKLQAETFFICPRIVSFDLFSDKQLHESGIPTLFSFHRTAFL